MDLALQDSASPAMTRVRSVGWTLGGLFGAGVGVASEWTWQGGWPVVAWAFMFLLFITYGYALLGTYIAGFFEDAWLNARAVIDEAEQLGSERDAA